MRILPEVIWITNGYIEEISGFRKKYKDSWIKGACDKTNKKIYLNQRINKMVHSTTNLIDCLLHEFLHYLSGSKYGILDTILDGLLDSFNRFNEKYIWNVRVYHNKKERVFRIFK